MRLLAAIVEGEVDWADFFFLMGVISAVLAFIASVARQFAPLFNPALAAAVTFIAAGFLML